MFTLVLQNTSTRKEYVVQHLTNTSPSPLYYNFPRFRMPVGAEPGEYRCALIWDGRDDTVYLTGDDLMETLIQTEEGDVYLKDLRPEVFLLRFGQVEDKGVTIEKNKGYVYYRR